jgi:hypothetical protein
MAAPFHETIEMRKSKRERYQLDSDPFRRQNAASYQRHREKRLVKAKQYAEANAEKVREYQTRYRDLHREALRAYARAHPEHNRQSARLRHVQENRPAWADRTALKAFYAACPPGMHVDHVVPLGGRKEHALTAEGYPISGLHVPWNLQYLPSEENHKKKHRMRAED